MPASPSQERPSVEAAATIKVMVPRLPGRAALEPYIDRIDRARHYTNFGPLNNELEARHAERLGLPRDCITSVGNATLGLTLALQAVGAATGTLCIMPAWTFVATPLAAMSAGMVPYFIDVDPQTWALEPDTVRQAIAAAPGQVGAIMPVLPFGMPMPVTAWDELTDRTGIPVVLDAAAAVDTVKPGRTPSVVSLHATKLLGAGEGGFVASTDASLIAKVRSLSVFGFQGTRLSQLAGTNAKMSEYHAAVGLAALDEWSEMRRTYVSLAQAYARAFATGHHARLQTGFGDDWVGPTCVVSFGDADADAIAGSLAAAGIETRRWWERGAHWHPATEAFPRADLAVTHHLARTTLGLPFHPWMANADIARIAEALDKAAVPAR